MLGTVSAGWMSRLFRFLLLLALLLSTVVYFLSCILDASPLSTNIHPINTTKSYSKTPLKWFQKWPATTNKDNHTQKETYSRKDFNISNQTTTNKQINNTTKQIFVNKTYTANGWNATFLSFKAEEKVFTKTNKSDNLNTPKAPLPLCSEIPTGLGPIHVNKSELNLYDVDKRFPIVQYGGRYAPPDCIARHRIAIIVPFRDRDTHLAIFLNHMHPFLMKQQLEYGIFIMEQHRYRAFNRAKLLNVGFVESQKEKEGGWECFFFHDVDLLPLDQRNLYYCPERPLHLSVLIDIFDFKDKYVFGGVIAMTVDQFTKVNGFSNKYWGWGGEDDDMRQRVQKVYYDFSRYSHLPITKYVMLNHESSFGNPLRYKLLEQTSQTMNVDGLSTLQYKVLRRVKHHLYTHFIVDLSKRH